jgi:hypothetical protein
MVDPDWYCLAIPLSLVGMSRFSTDVNRYGFLHFCSPNGFPSGVTMMMKKLLQVAFLFLAFAMVSGLAMGQENENNEKSPNDTAISAQPSSSSVASQYKNENSQQKPMTFRQYRARVEMQQMLMRAEYYKWIGYEPLRPNISATPAFNLPSAVYWTPYNARVYYPTASGNVFRW